MKYIEFINQQIIRTLENRTFPVCIFGQNVKAGSCLGGLTKNLPEFPGRIINAPNCELTLCGVGMGMMSAGMDSIFFMKQLDFLLLGMDQLTHTWNVLRHRKGLGSFTIFTVITDNGLEGKQSCFQRLETLSACAHINAFEITKSKLIHPFAIAEVIIKHQLINEGFRIIAVSQTLLQKEVE